MLDIALVQQCSPQLPMAIAQAIVKTESSFNPFAIGVNRGGSRLVKQPSNFSEAVQTAKQFLARGANIDLGLGQINSANLKWLGLTVEQVFDPCNNLKAMQTVYLHCYSRTGNTGLGTRMQRAFSCYNTGNMRLGFSNGYVNKVTRNLNDFVEQERFKKIQYQQYPDLQVYTPNYAHTHAQKPLQGGELGIQSQTLQMAQNTLKMQNTVDLEQQGQITDQSIQNASADRLLQTIEFHSWDIFGDYGFVK